MTAPLNYNQKRHTLIVGGTGGLGRALVKVLAEEGYSLSIMARRYPSEIKSETAIEYWTVDIVDERQIAETLDRIIAERGNLSNLIFLQRYRGQGDDWQGEIETSLTATRNIIEIVADRFEEWQEKSIVIVGSALNHFVTKTQNLSYHVAKAGIEQMVRYYAVKLGARGIRVNAVSSATILKEESKEFYLQNEPLQNLYKKITPLGRMGTAEEVAQAIAFLCSPKASFITGQNLVVDGGISLQWHESLARELLQL